MALKTNYPQPKPAPKGVLPKDVAPMEHDTTSGETYGTTEGVKPSGTSFEQLEVIPENVPPPGSDLTPTDPEAPIDVMAAGRGKGRGKGRR